MTGGTNHNNQQDYFNLQYLAF